MLSAYKLTTRHFAYEQRAMKSCSTKHYDTAFFSFMAASFKSNKLTI